MVGEVENILRVLDKATSVDREEGEIAYPRYREVCRGLADYYGYTLEEVIAVFAATSPNNDYVGNLRSTASVLRAHKENVPASRVRVACYNHCRDRAYTYLNGVSFLGTVKGEKIRNFYQNILNPEDGYPVTIDGHAVNVYRGVRVNLKDIAVARFNYAEVALAYRSAAFRAGLLPNQLQAITWLTWRRINRIYSPNLNLNLFREVEGDYYYTLRSPEDIKPYPYI